jgi:hypothetical protein
MIIMNANPPQRPPCCSFDSMASLYAVFESLVAEVSGRIKSSCGHDILIFDHHFFHLAAVSRSSVSVLSMPRERTEILATTQGFGRYVIGHGMSRARNLSSAFQTLCEPDEVWAGNPIIETAKWVYIKQFESKPYPYTVALVGDRPDKGGIIVPFSSFPCRNKGLKKWRQGKCIHSKQIQPPSGG